jgi:hypothetical protein
MNVPRVCELIIEHEKVYDIFIATIGYEQRSRFVIDSLKVDAKLKVAFGFTWDHIFHYDDNAAWLIASGYDSLHCDDEAFAFELDKIIVEALSTNGSNTLKIGVDISSATRARVAMILICVQKRSSRKHIEIDFFYSLAKFSPAPSSSHPNTHFGPVLPAFSGWWTEPERPLAAALGLGYEENKALGAVEYVQASSIWTFTPESPEAYYAPALQEANATLLTLVPATNRFKYSVSEALDIFIQLESFAFGVTRSHNLILLPFGPKLFALAALLVGMIHPEVAVWRVSGGEDRTDREASGDIFGLTVQFLGETGIDLAETNSLV